MTSFSHYRSTVTSKKTVFFLLTICLAMVSLAVFLLVNNTYFTKTPVTVKGTIQQGIEANRPVTHPYMKTTTGIYYLEDHTDEISRRRRITERCPSGQVSCFHIVKVNGYITNKSLPMFPLKPASLFEEDTRVNHQQFEAQELVVLSFEVLE